jgi:hypothetical protein
MSPRRRIPFSAVAVTAAATVAVSPVVMAALITPAWAERVPPGLSRPGTAQAPTPSAGTVVTIRLAGPARLDTPSTLTARAVVDVSAPTRGTIRISALGRTCRAADTLAAGRTTLRVTCRVSPTAKQIPAMTAGVDVRLERVVSGRVATTVRTARASLPLDDGEPLEATRAAARWRAVAARYRAAARGATTASTGAALAQAASRTTAADAASLVWEEAQSSGWRSAATKSRIAALLATRTSTGGYGLSAAWDAYGDGTVNPAGTTYTVTTAGHVGWVLIEAAKNAALPAGALESAVDAVLAIPRVNGGTCLAYSDSPHDAAKPCVYNVSHGAAAFLVQVRRLTDHRAAEVDALVSALRSKLTSGYDPVTGYWQYMAGAGKAQDISHQVYTAKSVDIVDPGFGAVRRMMALPWWRQPRGTSQTRVALASAMLDIAKDCDYARSPAVLLAVERGSGEGAPVFTRLGMADVADEIVDRCFG